MASIILALNWLENTNVYVETVILSDSLSALVAIRQRKETCFVIKILTMITKLRYQGKVVNLEWIPSHCGIHGNEIADFFAKAALGKEVEIFNKLSLTEIKSEILKIYIQLWQDRWNLSRCTLKEVQPLVNKLYQCKLNRFYANILHRLRFGVIGLNTDLLRMKIHPTGNCENCNQVETIQHFLTECPKFMIERAMLIVETDISDTNEIMRLLKSSDTEKQRAIVRFVLRTKRLYKNN